MHLRRRQRIALRELRAAREEEILARPGERVAGVDGRRVPHALGPAGRRDSSMFDLLIRGATIIDGTGGPARSGDVAVAGGRIGAIGALAGAGYPPEWSVGRVPRRVIDATGQVVTPGFIDIHTHADIALLARPAHEPKVMQGVTTSPTVRCASR
jgi:adenine deaminase